MIRFAVGSSLPKKSSPPFSRARTIKTSLKNDFRSKNRIYFLAVSFSAATGFSSTTGWSTHSI